MIGLFCIPGASNYICTGLSFAALSQEEVWLRDYYLILGEYYIVDVHHRVINSKCLKRRCKRLGRILEIHDDPINPTWNKLHSALR